MKLKIGPMNREMKGFLKWGIPLLFFIAAISHFLKEFGLNFLVLVLILIAVFYIMNEQLPRIERSIRKELRLINETLIEGFKLKKSSNPEKKKEEEIKTSGAGAFGGMIIGGALGLPFGPGGVIIGGIIGAIVGDNIERERIKAEEKPK